VRPDPVSAGLTGNCPACGRGKLFSGFLKLAEHCSACGADFSRADTGDGPAVFVILIVGALVVPAMLVVEVAFQPPYWLHLALWIPLALGLCIGLLRPFKGVLFCLQWRTKAQEGRRQ
jgi:uncharacterized protein (DUF983 family)